MDVPVSEILFRACLYLSSTPIRPTTLSKYIAIGNSFQCATVQNDCNSEVRAIWSRLGLLIEYENGIIPLKCNNISNVNIQYDNSYGLTSIDRQERKVSCSRKFSEIECDANNAIVL